MDQPASPDAAPHAALADDEEAALPEQDDPAPDESEPALGEDLAPDEDADPDSPDINPDDPNWLADYQATNRRWRHDGWTPDRQYAFLLALAQTGCVVEACRAVGKAPASAYRLRRESTSEHFRRAWDAALDHAVARLSDAAIGRALNGTTRPVFFKGEQIGERRYFDERLTMFILRYRDPARYGKWLDLMSIDQPGDGPTFIAEHFARRAHEDALAWELRLPRRPGSTMPIRFNGDAPERRTPQPCGEPSMDYEERDDPVGERADLNRPRTRPGRADSRGFDDSGCDVP